MHSESHDIKLQNLFFAFDEIGLTLMVSMINDLMDDDDLVEIMC